MQKKLSIFDTKMSLGQTPLIRTATQIGECIYTHYVRMGETILSFLERIYDGASQYAMDCCLFTQLVNLAMQGSWPSIDGGHITLYANNKHFVCLFLIKTVKYITLTHCVNYTSNIPQGSCQLKLLNNKYLAVDSSQIITKWLSDNTKAIACPNSSLLPLFKDILCAYNLYSKQYFQLSIKPRMDSGNTHTHRLCENCLRKRKLEHMNNVRNFKQRLEVVSNSCPEFEMRDYSVDPNTLQQEMLIDTFQPNKKSHNISPSEKQPLQIKFNKDSSDDVVMTDTNSILSSKRRRVSMTDKPDDSMEFDERWIQIQKKLVQVVDLLDKIKLDE